MPRRKPTLTVVGGPVVTWPDWYNAQSADRQAEFDARVSVLDRGGKPYEAGGAYENWIENLKGDPELYAQVKNYRDTGGRRALFSPKVTDYGSNPISVVKPGGPIENVGGFVTLHPGRYSYSATHDADKAFRAWLDAHRETVTVGQQQVSEAAVAGAPYYTDFELRVWKDTPWAADVPGIPTWLPDSYSLEKYWGAPTPSAKPDWQALETGASYGKTILALAIVAAGVWMLEELRPRRIVVENNG